KTLSDAMASEMTQWCEEMGIAADENIFKARLEEDISVNKLNIENCVKDAMRDMGHEGAVVTFDPNKAQDVTDLLHQDAENMELSKEKSEQIFSNVMDAVKAQESQETVTALSLDELGMDSHQVESVITSVSEYDRSNFSHYPDIKPINGEIVTRGQLNALRVCLGKKIYQDANDVKEKNFKALDERGATKEVRQAEKELHKELKTLVSSMEEHNVKTIDELKKAIEYQKEQENLQKEEEKTLTHEDIVAANAVNDLAFGLMASNARGMDAVPDGRDVDEIISEVQDELDMPSSALDGIDLDSIEQEI
ncbi:MAG: hypothetical protein IK121_07720, partial [Lachnospiraceae bacterium]|nr:hypothetical protein [Lachnospiraceae bacterium]